MFSSYHPAAWFGHHRNGQRHYHSTTLAWDDTDSVARGSSALATLSPWFPEWWTSVKAGTAIELCEGSMVVATAEVIAVERSEEN